MRVVMFYHSLVSDWNHGNAHFLRGVASELIARGHEVRVYEPQAGWSLSHLLRERGSSALAAFHAAYPTLDSVRYDPLTFELERALDGAELVIVHEWNPPELIARIGAYRARTPGLRLMFHDTHHRAESAPHELAQFQLQHYDAVLAFGAALRERYLAQGWAKRVYVWHEAADTRVFYPRPAQEPRGDLVWIGNWGDGERSRELQAFLFGPIADLGMTACIYGVRYPPEALASLAQTGARFAGFLPNFAVPEIFANYRVTVHVPRQPYATALAGIPTIRVFEALACGIPLVSAPWQDCEGLFSAGRDFLIAHTRREMTDNLRLLLNDSALAQALSAHGLETIRARHTCAHRVDELLQIHHSLGSD